MQTTNVDTQWWAKRGADDAARDKAPIFRHARRNSGSRVTAVGDAPFDTAEEEDEAGRAYLSGYDSNR